MKKKVKEFKKFDNKFSLKYFKFYLFFSHYSLLRVTFLLLIYSYKKKKNQINKTKLLLSI